VPGGGRLNHSRGVRSLRVADPGASTLWPGQVACDNNLSAHKGSRVRQLVEEPGCKLMYLPPYFSPNYNPIEQAFSKVKRLLRRVEARTHKALVEAMGITALSTVTTQDVHGYFEKRDYRASCQLP
jgi:hypothetical protein